MLGAVAGSCRRVRTGWVVALSLLLVGRSLAVGQTPPKAQPNTPPKTQPKPDAPPPNEFSLTGALGERATSNVRGVPDNSTDPPPQGDYVSDLRLSFSVVRRSERTDWTLSYQPFLTRYRESSDLNTGNHTFDFDGRYDVSRRVKLTLGQHGNYSRNPLYVARFETGNAPIVTQETKRWTSRASFDAAIQISRTLALHAGGAYGVARFEDPNFYDNQNYSASTGLDKTISRDQTISATYNYSHFVLTAPQLPQSITDAHTVGTAWSYNLTGASGAGISLGATQVSQTGTQQTLFTGDASYHYAFRPLALSIGYRQGLGADLGVSQVNLSRDSYASLSGKAGRSAHWGLVGNYGTRTSALDFGGSENITYIGGAVRGDVILGERLSLLGEVSHRRQDNSGGTVTAGQIPSGQVTVDWIFLGLQFKIF
jgi:hypothetical protein